MLLKIDRFKAIYFWILGKLAYSMAMEQKPSQLLRKSYAQMGGPVLLLPRLDKLVVKKLPPYRSLWVSMGRVFFLFSRESLQNSGKHTNLFYYTI